VTKYFGGLAAVSDVSFYLNQGEILGLIGPNGAARRPSSTSLPGLQTQSGKNLFPGPGDQPSEAQ